MSCVYKVIILSVIAIKQNEKSHNTQYFNVNYFLNLYFNSIINYSTYCWYNVITWSLNVLNIKFELLKTVLYYNLVYN